MNILKKILCCLLVICLISNLNLVVFAEEYESIESGSTGGIIVDEDASDDLVMYGNASKQEDGSVELTPLATWSSGSVWYGRQIDANSGFTARVEYWAGGGRDDSYGGADGIVMTFSEETGLGDEGEYLGFVTGSYGVELDSYPENPGDPDGKHVAIIYDEVSNHLTYSLDDRVDDSQWHTLEVTYTPGTLTVSLDGEQVLAQEDVTLPDRIYLGISASTGGGKNQHLIKDFYMKGVVSEGGSFDESPEDNEAEEKQINIPYSGSELSAAYSDSYFNSSSYNYNHNLAWLTLCLELSSWTADATTWGESASDNSDLAKSRYANIASAYDQMEFPEVEYFNYGTTLNDTSDKVAFSIAKKSNVYGATLVAIVVRGGGYGGEWSSNFNVGTGEYYHNGFNNSAEKVYQQVLAELTEIDGDVKLWVTGYSRGAATANLLAAKLDEYSNTSDQFDADDIFAYTFATPQGVTTSKNTTDALYKNIFNIVNPGDFIPLAAPSGWNFTRYGIVRYFDSSASAETFSAVNTSYGVLTGGQTLNSKSNIQQSAAGSALMKIILSAFPSTKSSAEMQRVLMELFEFTNTKKYDNSNSKWTDIGIDDFHQMLIDRYGDDFFIAFQYAHSFLTVTGDGQLLMNLLEGNEEAQDYVYLFFTLCELHGLNSCDLVKTVFDLLNSENIRAAATAYFNLPSGIGGVVTAHTPSVYLAWMSLKEEVTFGNTDYSNVGNSKPRRTTVVKIACPVDVVVYDQDGNTVAAIVDHQIVDASIPVIIDGEATELFFDAVADYTIEITPTDSGAMTYTVTELDINESVVTRVNYYDIPLEVNQTFTGTIETSDEYTDGKYDLSCYDGESEIIVPADEVLTSEYTVTLNVDVTGKGSVVGSGEYVKGDTVRLRAYAFEGYEFAGWYSEEQLVSDEDTYCIRVVEDTMLAAKFNAHTHTYGDWMVTQAATCTEKGEESRTCPCGEIETREIDALGHTAADAVKENEVAASCGTDGSYDSVVYCVTCGSELSRATVTVPATGEHNYVTEQERVEATCSEDGYVTMACDCGLTETIILPASSHSYESVVTDPTCTEQGFTTHTCSFCGDSYVDTYVDATGHTFENGVCIECGTTNSDDESNCNWLDVINDIISKLIFWIIGKFPWH
ncbi:MAG: hypothetical protein PUB22_02255 [Clostridiales bacterium]|nr:hypothetical protein [Clostridiales bacterium]